MPAFNFHARFAPLVADGAKRMTIRRDRADGMVWPVGAPVMLYTGMRTKSCTLLGRSVLVGSREIRIGLGLVFVDSKALPPLEVEELARADGFSSVEAFFAWFDGPDEDGHHSCFRGRLYAWGDLS